MGKILVLPIRPLATRHGHEQSAVAADDLESPDDERVVERDAHERFQLLVVPKRYTNLGDLDHEMFTSEPSLRFSWLVCGAVIGRRTWVERPLESPSVASWKTRGFGDANLSPPNEPGTAARPPKSGPRSPRPMLRAARSRTLPNHCRSVVARADPPSAAVRTARRNLADGVPEVVRTDCPDG